MNDLIDAINDQCDENFHIVVEGYWVALYNGDTEITSGPDTEVEARLRQIAHENGVQYDD